MQPGNTKRFTGQSAYGNQHLNGTFPGSSTNLSQSNGVLGQFQDGAFPLDDLQAGGYGIQPQPQAFGAPQSFDQSLGFSDLSGNTITGFEMQESLNFGVGPSREMAFPAPFPEDTCNKAMLEQSYPPQFNLQAGYQHDNNNAFPGGYVTQPDIQLGAAVDTGLGPDWMVDSSLFPPPGQDADLNMVQPNHGLGASLPYIGSSEQTWVAPSSYAVLQPLAAPHPIRDQNILAHAEYRCT